MNEYIAVKDKTVDVILDDQTVVLHKIPLKKYADLMEMLDEIPKQFENLDQLQQDKIIQMMPKLLKNSLAEVTKVIALGTQLTEEQVGELGAHELVRLFAGIILVNKYEEVFEVIKKIFAQPQMKAPVPQPTNIPA